MVSGMEEELVGGGSSIVATGLGAAAPGGAIPNAV
jgi:hypothetical protein